MRDEDLIEQALQQWRVSAEALSEQRAREIEDLSFQVPELQWPEAVREQRRGGVVGNLVLPPRPVLSVSMVDQPVQLVQNQQRAAHLGVQIHPVDTQADDDTAEVLQDLYRAIERDSNAEQVRAWAFDRALKCGLGWYLVVPEYGPVHGPTPGVFDQVIRIKRILNGASVYPDPFAVEADFSDMRWAFLTADVPWAVYRQQYPRSAVAGWDAQEFTGLGDLQRTWMGGSDAASRTVRVASWFTVASDAVTYSALPDGSVVEGAVAGAVTTRTLERPKVVWRTINAVEVLETTELPGPWIPLVPVIGRELQMFDQRRRWVGLYTNAKDAQRLLNYGVANMVEVAALAPKATWLVAEGQEEGHEAEFEASNTRNLPYLRYKPTTLNGQLVGPPTRMVPSADVSTAVALIQESREFIRSVMATFEPSLGQDSSRAKSGRAILALQGQADAAHSGYVENLAGISMHHEARIVLSWMPEYYDRPGRVVQVIGEDLAERQVMVNAPFVADPQTGRPRPAGGAERAARHYDLRKGTYGVAVSVGKAYTTKLQEGSDALGELMKAAPELLRVMGDIWAGLQSFPGHAEVAKRFRAMLPPQFRDEGEADPEALQAQLGQMQQAIQRLTAGLQEAQQIIDTKQIEHAADVEKQRTAEEAKLFLAKLKAETDLALAKIKAEVEIQTTRQEIRAKAVLQDDQQQHEMAMAAAEVATRPAPISADEDDRRDQGSDDD